MISEINVAALSPAGGQPSATVTALDLEGSTRCKTLAAAASSCTACLTCAAGVWRLRLPTRTGEQLHLTCSCSELMADVWDSRGLDPGAKSPIENTIACDLWQPRGDVDEQT